ncbi:MAG: BamA/TamA family outer membrane protein [Proteobacteria bacterium]|nr:BamA/TamA family outer membrane protein [Pseudomonadota bacterium]
MKIITLCCALTIFTVRTAIAAEVETRVGAPACSSVFEPASGAYLFVQEESIDYDIADNARVGEIYYTRLPIFDEANPGENNAVFRWANRFHILTRENVVSQQVLIARGDQYDERLIAETGRLLRKQAYFYDVDVRPVRLCGGEVDVEVITRDNWSLTPNIAFDRSGGENSYSFGIRDSNILGLGKQFEIASSEDTERRSQQLIYEDHNVLGSRVRTRSKYIDSDDGSSRLFELNLPFFSLDSRRSWGIFLEDGEREDKQYFRGDDISKLEHDIKDFKVEFGWSAGLEDNVSSRWTLGYHYRRDEFRRSDELPPPSVFPTDRELSYPYVGFESIEDKFDTAFNLDQIYRTEDLQLGQHLSSTLGFASSALGSDQDRVVAAGFFSDTLMYTDDILWQHTLEWEGSWNLDSKAVEDVVISYETRYFRQKTSRRAFFASFEAIYSRNLNTNTQIFFGGLTGARAFDNRFQVGDRRVSLTLEERIYTDIHLFNLIRVGGAFFFDVGRAWKSGVDNGVEDELLADIGFGIRLLSSKSASGRVVHIDFAVPLTNRNDPDVNKIQIAFNIKSSF